MDEEELARQITIMQFQIFSSIKVRALRRRFTVKPAELLNQAWSKAKLKHRAQNALALIEHFNSVSMWVGYMIAMAPKVKQRAKILAKFIKLAKVRPTLAHPPFF